MKNTIGVLLVLNVVLSSAAFLVQRFEPSSDNETESSSDESVIGVEFSNFEQKLDHFDFEDDRKFNQSAWYTTAYFKDGGPAFLLINGEWVVDEEKEFNNASWVSYAKTFNAACFTFEHRYYGKSWPETHSKKYLNSAQALADIEYFIETVTEENSWLENSKWIVFGSSYAGNLAAWARLRYPHLIHGAVASSAPLLSKVAYEDYGQVVENALESYDVKCVESLERVTEQITDLYNQTENIKNISKMFYLRYDYYPEDMDDIVKYLYSELYDILTTAAQYNDTTAINIPIVCDSMISHNGTELEAFAELRKKYTDSQKNTTGWSYSSRQTWNYQFCSEIGGFATFESTRYLSAIGHLTPLEERVKSRCELFFGPNFDVEEMDKKMRRTNNVYGGLNFNVANTVFLQGSTDPWHPSGPCNKTEDSLYEIIFIKGTAHCADTNLALVKKNPELKKAYDEVVKILGKWLSK